MIEIDGSQGEGGGQILRSALTLSMLTGKAFLIHNIRAHRNKPGLLHQHLSAVKASSAVSKANVSGASIGSKLLSFEPGVIRSGRYNFDIHTAGSASLLLQTILQPLSLANSASTIIISGGTHVPWSPSFHYLEQNWQPIMKSIGFDFKLSLDRAGFYPQGGGRVTATIRPAQKLIPLNLTFRGELQRIYGLSAVANLDISIADRQKRQVLGKLLGRFPNLMIKTSKLRSQSKGTAIFIKAEFAGDNPSTPASCCYTALGERGKPAEIVGNEVVDRFEAFIATDGAVDQYLADQLLLPLSFAGGVSMIRTSQITAHLLTNATVINEFLPTKIEIVGTIGKPGFVRIMPQ